MNLFNFIPGYESTIFKEGREPALVMLLAFVITYLLARGYTRIARKTGWGSASFGGVHAHHMVFGMVVAFLAGALMFGFMPTYAPFILLLAATFGVGTALVLDEFALFFHLEDVYWEQEGRKSVDAVVLAFLFGVLFLLHTPPLGTHTTSFGISLIGILLFNLPIVVIAGLKGKIYLAIFGVFIPLLALIAAVRLAEPGSIWFKWFYKPNSRRARRSVARYERYEQTWRQRKEWAWDIIGGKTGRPPKQS